jgi:hypothetical protein
MEIIIVAGRGRFRGSFGGRVLVETSSTPFLDAARVLAGEGGDPATRIVMRHEGQSYDALISTVGAAAKLTVEDDGAPRFRRWKPFLSWDRSPPISETDPAITPAAPDASAPPPPSYGKGASTR